MSTAETQHIGQLTPNVEECHVIRSHRKPRGYNRIGIVFIAAALLGAGYVSSATAPESPSPAMVEAQATEVVPATFQASVERVERSSRSVQHRKLTRAQKIEKVISFAMAQRGDRYRWGAAGPSRWDCSGLVMKAFAKGGKKLPHQTGGIQKKGSKVSKKNLKRGDIVFPQRGHVGIYLGKGMMVHASSGKGKVIKAKVYGFYTARRVL